MKRSTPGVFVIISMNSEGFRNPFENIYGHQNIIDSLEFAVSRGRLHHALLFCGMEGTGKRSVAVALAKSIFCNGASNPVKISNRINNNTWEDLILVDTEWAVKNPTQNIKIEAIRELESRVIKGPFESPNLVVIIDSMDKMMPASSNALLKTLEEPPSGTFLILLATSAESVLPTIRSRCNLINFAPLDDSILLQYLQDNYPDISEDLGANLISLSRGSIGTLNDFISDENFGGLLTLSQEMVNCIIGGNMQTILELSEAASSDPQSIQRLFRLFEMRLGQIIQNGISGRKPVPDFNEWFKIIKKSAGEINTNVNKRLFFEHLLWTLRRS
ncbi:AAA family ATPase [Myxococcota bacterium]|nr:AAA family ATPase [Myxococcota bacterium]